MRAGAVVKILLVAAAVVAGLYLLYQIRSVIGGVLIAVFLAVALGPAVDFFQRRRIPRGFAILLTYLCIFFAIFLVGLLIVPPIVEEVNNFAADVPEYIADLRDNGTIREYDEKYGIVERLQGQAEQLPARLDDAASALQAVTVGVFSAIFQLLTVLVLTFFLLLDGRRIVDWGIRELGPVRGPRWRSIAENVYRAVGGYVLGTVMIAIVAATTTFVVLTILGVPFAVPLAVLMLFLDMVPLVGATIAAVLIALVVAIDAFPVGLIVWAIYAFVYQQFENNVLQPVVYRKTVALHPLIVLIAVLIGATLLGVLGALVAIPIAAAIQIMAKDWWKLRKARPSEIVPQPGETATGTGVIVPAGEGEPPATERVAPPRGDGEAPEPA